MSGRNTSATANRVTGATMRANGSGAGASSPSMRAAIGDASVAAATGASRNNRVTCASGCPGRATTARATYSPGGRMPSSSVATNPRWPADRVTDSASARTSAGDRSDSATSTATRVAARRPPSAPASSSSADMVSL